MARAQQATASGFENLRVLVVGGTGRIGSALVRELVDRGARVAFQYRSSRERAIGLVEETGAMAVQHEMASSAEIASAVAEATEVLGGLDAFVNTVHPQFVPTPIADVKDDEVERHIEAFRLHLRLCRAVLPQFYRQGFGRIVFVSGALSRRPIEGCAVYSGVKAGVEALQRGIALESGPHNVTVNSVAPGRVIPDDDRAPTDGHSSWVAAEDGQGVRKALRRPPSASEVSYVVCSLLSRDASAVTGQVVYLAQGEVMS